VEKREWKYRHERRGNADDENAGVETFAPYAITVGQIILHWI